MKEGEKGRSHVCLPTRALVVIFVYFAYSFVLHILLY